MRASVLFSGFLIAGACMTEGEVHAAPPLATPMVELGAPNHARVGGEGIEFDGAAQALYWPALARVYEAKGKPARVVIAAPRNARVLDVLRAVFTLRDVDVELQTLGPGNEVRPLVISPRPPLRPEGPTCHAAFFVSPEGKIRAAVPDGSVQVKDTTALVASIAQGMKSCKVRWLAFGAESNEMAWGWVFDVAAQVDLAHVAPGVRFVLGEPIRGGR